MKPLESAVSVLMDAKKALIEAVDGRLDPSDAESVLDSVTAVLALPELEEIFLRFTEEALNWEDEDDKES